MSDEEALTKFQQNCLQAVEALLRSLGLPDQLKLVKGQKENYLRSELFHNGKNFKIYVYYDEAGFRLDRVWHAYETPDFDSPGELIEKFSKDLGNALREDIKTTLPGG
jgi:hypothetical protein